MKIKKETQTETTNELKKERQNERKKDGELKEHIYNLKRRNENFRKKYNKAYILPYRFSWPPKE